MYRYVRFAKVQQKNHSHKREMVFAVSMTTREKHLISPTGLIGTPPASSPMRRLLKVTSRGARGYEPSYR